MHARLSKGKLTWHQVYYVGYHFFYIENIGTIYKDCRLQYIVV